MTFKSGIFDKEWNIVVDIVGGFLNAKMVRLGKKGKEHEKKQLIWGWLIGGADAIEVLFHRHAYFVDYAKTLQ